MWEEWCDYLLRWMINHVLSAVKQSLGDEAMRDDAV